VRCGYDRPTFVKEKYCTIGNIIFIDRWLLVFLLVYSSATSALSFSALLAVIDGSVSHCSILAL